MLFTNRLTKSYFSLHDTSLSNRLAKNIIKTDRNNTKQLVKIKGAASKLLDRYHSQKD